MIPISQEVKTCDVLIMGGGIAGLMTAISAADNGASVIIAEKSDTRRSGSGATGNDHFVCFIPEVHGDFEAYIRELKTTQAGRNADQPLLRQFAARSFEVVQDWHKWGINMRVDDQWTFEGHAYPGHMRTHLKYDGHNQKSILTNEARKRGVIIDNHTPITEVLLDEEGRVIGALGVDVSKEQPELKVYRCKVLVTATGSTNRIYPSTTPAWMFNMSGCPSCCGGGNAVCYRAGATMVNLDIPSMPAGPKYFHRAGKGTWIGVLRDIHGNNIGPFIDKPSREHGDITADVWPSVFYDMNLNGSGPVYMDCSELSEDEMQYLYWAFACEGDTSLVDAMNKQGIDLREKMVEFGTYESHLVGRGVQIDLNCATNVPGLYAVGDQVGNFCANIGGCATYGRICGEAVASYCTEASFSDSVANHPTVLERQAFYSAMLERKNGPSWKELNIIINQLMDDYCPVFHVRSGGKFTAGIGYFEDLRRQCTDSICCSNAHELMRAIETFDILDIAEAVIRCASERKETRGLHKRPDYPFTNPMLNNHFFMITKTSEGPKIEVRPAQ